MSSKPRFSPSFLKIVAGPLCGWTSRFQTRSTSYVLPEVRNFGVPSDHLRSEISFLRTCNILNFISCILSHTPSNAWNTSLIVCLCGCAIACALKKHLRSVKFSSREHRSQVTLNLIVRSHQPPPVELQHRTCQCQSPSSQPWDCPGCLGIRSLCPRTNFSSGSWAGFLHWPQLFRLNAFLFIEIATCWWLRSNRWSLPDKWIFKRRDSWLRPQRSIFHFSSALQLQTNQRFVSWYLTWIDNFFIF